jgi:hypothetical protein
MYLGLNGLKQTGNWNIALLVLFGFLLGSFSDLMGIPVWTGDIFAYRLLFSQPFFAYVLLKLVSGCGFWRGFTSSEGWE